MITQKKSDIFIQERIN